MPWPTAILVYVIIWWVVLFAVLPWGVRQSEHVEPGQDPGAPENPRLLLKAAVTTVVAAVIWLGFYWLYQSGLVSFRE